MANRVKTMTGQTLDLASATEVSFYTQAQEKYLAENSFVDSSDIRSLERLLSLELMAFRYQRDLIANVDDLGLPLDTKTVRAMQLSLKETIASINDVQADLGLLKSQREKDKLESIAKAWENITKRAKVFGIHRETQLDVALTLMNEMAGHVGAFNRANADERHKMGFDDEKAIVKWLTDYMIPKYNEVDEHFRANVQRYWHIDS